jgi:hypothetical protein
LEAGRSLRQFIRASQTYQAERLKSEIEAARLAQPECRGVLWTPFIDAEPCISASVVDCYRRPKWGLEALQAAYQPTLPVFTAERTTFTAAEPLPGTLSIVNDRAEPILDAMAELFLEIEKGVMVTWRTELSPLPAEGVVHDAILSSDPPHLQLPSNVPSGRALLRVLLRDRAGRRYGENVASLEVIEGTWTAEQPVR